LAIKQEAELGLGAPGLFLTTQPPDYKDTQKINNKRVQGDFLDPSKGLTVLATPSLKSCKLLLPLNVTITVSNPDWHRTINSHPN